MAGTRQIFHYAAYGVPLGFDPATAATKFLYSGEQTDSTGLQYLRARYYNPASGRFNRLDPFAGNMHDPQSLHKYLYAHGDPIGNTDPTGLFLLGGLIGAIGIGLTMYAMPGPEDFITGGLQALVEAYAVNLSWDVEWAQNWELSDSLHSRNDNLWVLAALGGGLYSAFDVYDPFYGTWNPLDGISGNATSSAARSSMSRGRGPSRRPRAPRIAGELASFSGYKTVPTAQGTTIEVALFTHPKLRRKVVVFPPHAIKGRVKIEPNGRRGMNLDQSKAASAKDIRDANKKYAKEQGYEDWESCGDHDWKDQFGEPMTWHHDVKKGEMVLVSRKAHEKAGHAGGNLVWYF